VAEYALEKRESNVLLPFGARSCILTFSAMLNFNIAENVKMQLQAPKGRSILLSLFSRACSATNKINASTVEAFLNDENNAILGGFVPHIHLIRGFVITP
jgi:hypothetical protein